MPPIPFKVPAWADPNNASVLDSPLQKAARTLGGMFGAADPQAQVMAIAAPLEIPEGGPLSTLTNRHSFVDQSAAPYLHRGQMQYPIDYAAATKASPTSVFRGVTQDEMESIAKTGKIKSTGRYSHSSEGTNFGDDFATAHSYVNVGHDNPAVTGKPTFVIEVKRGPEIVVDPRDYYPKSHQAIPIDRISRVWSFSPDGSVHLLPPPAKWGR